MSYQSLLYSHEIIVKYFEVFASIGNVNPMQRECRDLRNLPKDPKTVHLVKYFSLLEAKYCYQFFDNFLFLISRSALEAPPAPGRDLPRTPLKKTDDNAQDFKETGMYGIVNGGKILMISSLIFFCPLNVTKSNWHPSFERIHACHHGRQIFFIQPLILCNNSDDLFKAFILQFEAFSIIIVLSHKILWEEFIIKTNHKVRPGIRGSV